MPAVVATASCVQRSGTVIGRSAELAALSQLVSGLRRGRGTALLLHGEAGMGKTTMLAELTSFCGDTITVLQAATAQSEVELAFSILSDLLEPVLGERATLPGPQAAALASALALGPPAPGDRLAVCVAALGVLRAAARRRPVLAVVDDIQWSDPASRECIEYVARRCGGFLAVVLAARDPCHSPVCSELPELHLAPLDEATAAELLRRRTPELAPPVAATIRRAAAGNPLALAELPSTLTADQRAGISPLPLPLAPGTRLQRAFAGRVAALSHPARLAGEQGIWHSALATIGPDETVAAGLESVGGRAVARRAYAAGAEALERSARLSPDRDTAGRRLLAAGQAAAGAGQADHALALLAEAADMAITDEQRAWAQQARGRMLIWRGRAAEATPQLAARAGILRPRERFERECCPLRVQFHASVGDLGPQDAAVLRLRQRVDGNVVGGYSVVLLPAGRLP